jgi:hypothetical protein
LCKAVSPAEPTSRYFVTDNVAVLLTPPPVHVIVTDLVAVWVFVVIVKVAVVLPFTTETVAGTVATAVLDDKQVTEKPSAPGAELRVIVPVTLVPPLTLDALSVHALTDGALFTVNAAVFETPA